MTPRRDAIEVPISGDLDINGWDLRKALGLMRESNPTLLEWLRSPIVYRDDAVAMPRFRALFEAVFLHARGWHHYSSMAKKNFREHLQADEVRYKKYLYVLRPLPAARWTRSQPGVPPMRFADLAQRTPGPGARRGALIDEINALLEVKMRAGEAATSPRWPGIHARSSNPSWQPMRRSRRRRRRRPEEAGLDAFLHETVLRFEKGKTEAAHD